MPRIAIFGLLSVLLSVAGYHFIYRAYLTNASKGVASQIESLDASYVFPTCMPLSLRTPGSRVEVLQCSKMFTEVLPAKTKSFTGAAVWPFSFSVEQARVVYVGVNEARSVYQLPPMPPFEALTNRVTKPVS